MICSGETFSEREKNAFLDKVLIGDECWEWTGAHTPQGYTRLCYAGNSRPAHRFAYLWLFGDIPDDFDLDHLCRNRGCVNPSHLEPVTRRENLLRGDTFAARNAFRTHCPSGHEYTEDNISMFRGQRRCRECGRQAISHRYYEKKKG